MLPLCWWLRRSAGLDASELAVGFLTFHAAFLINDPHFSVTYLLFYRNARNRAFGDVFNRAQRARYWVAGAVVPCALAGWAVWAIACDSAASLGLMMQLMFFLVGWHYVKQGFGILTVISARHGFRFRPRERRLLLAHCFAAWFYARANPADPGTEYLEKGVLFRSLPHPPGLEAITLALLVMSCLGLAWALGSMWRREKRLPPLAALTGFLVTIWLWVVYSSIDPLLVYLIPALHSLQYLYFVWLSQRNRALAEEGPPHFGRSVSVRLSILGASAVGLAWVFFHGAPSFLDEVLFPEAREGASPMGATPFLAAIVTLVNIHHYFMDAVIWRRENPDSRFLMDASGAAEPAAG